MNKNDPPRKALGKGLQALLPRRDNAVAAPVAPSEPREGNVSVVPIGQLAPNLDQPRQDFEPEPLMELAESIRREGVLQPILVRRMAPDQYQIIAGERRWRAATMAGLKEVPIVLRAADDQKALELALIENIQRENLNPIELAKAFHRMASDLGLTHDQIGEKTGKDRVTVSNVIRLLQLSKPLQLLVSKHMLSPGHARALLKITDEVAQHQVANRCIEEGWSVRQTEEFTRPAGLLKPPGGKKDKPAPPQLDANVRAAITEMERALGTRVRVTEKALGKGTIEIEYYSQDDLDRIYSLIVPEESGL